MQVELFVGQSGVISEPKRGHPANHRIKRAFLTTREPSKPVTRI